ncbi:hypothetical protein [Risungbinella massiliensis]|uniref:hypothetical protein n=1 Tax=Risungbinella massiliensis TaxID=1329796 RepID=UPI0011CBCA1E|nr:hypothetical protein [Risungbinella massiliensis]
MVGRLETGSVDIEESFPQNGSNIIPFRQIERVRELRDQEQKQLFVSDFGQWFQRYYRKESQTDWQNRFKELLQLPLNRPIPSRLELSYQHWLMFDSTSMNNRRPVEIWASTIRTKQMDDRIFHSFCHSHFDCLELVEEGIHTVLFCSLLTGKHYKVKKDKLTRNEPLIFARLIRCGNRYELFGPYASFVLEMRGEILVQLEKYKQQEEQHDIATREDGWKLLGWAIQKAKETERIENIMSTPADLLDQMRYNIMWPEGEKRTEKRGLPVHVMQQLEQYYVSQITPLQKKTQLYYSRSLELLFQYVSLRFGQSFEWSKLTEDVFSHFLGVWYIENSEPTPNASRVFLNTLKSLFRWLGNEGISSVYHSFKKVYIHLIRSLPATLEVKKWLKEHGSAITTQLEETPVHDVFLLSVSTTGPVVYVGNQWRECNLLNFPSLYVNQRFWIRGSLIVQQHLCTITELNQIYPMVPLEEEAIRDSSLMARK